MKASSPSPKAKSVALSNPARRRVAPGDLFLGYKALHELRILMRIAASPSTVESKSTKPSY